MNPSRIWGIGAVVAVIAVIGAAVGLGVQPALASASAADASTAQVVAQNSATATELTRLSRLAAKQSELDSENRSLRLAVPTRLQLNTFSRGLRSVAALDGVRITTLNPSVPVPYTPPVGIVAAAPTPAPTASSASPTPAPTPVTVPAPGTFGKTDPLITSSNLVVVPVTVIVMGEQDAVLAFTKDVQRMERLFEVFNVTYTESLDATSPSAATVSGYIYALKR